MTALAEPVTADEPRHVARADHKWTAGVAGFLVIFAVGYLTMPFAEATGGRGAWALTKAAIVVAIATVAAKPWRHLRAGVLWLAVSVAGAALAVCMLTTPGWFGATRAAAYGLGAATFVAVAAYARTRRRASVLAVVVCAAGVAQFSWSFLAWWGGRDQSVPMEGTFYWHNQYAAFLLAPTLIALCLVVEHRSPWRSAGWIMAPLGVAGAVYSASRGALVVLVCGWLFVGFMALRVRGSHRRALVRWLAVSAIAAGVTVVVAGPPFFSTSASPLAGTQARAAAGETATASGHFRVYLWRESVSVFEHHPVVGVGYGDLIPASEAVTPASWPRSPLSHDDYLQALAEGGLLLGVPFVMACAAVGFTLVTVVRRRSRGRRVDVRTGFAVGALALMAHAAIDFDWTYPALFTLCAAVAGVAVASMLPRPLSARSVSYGGSRRNDVARNLVARVAATAGLVALVLVGGIAGHIGADHLGYRSAAGQRQVEEVR